MAEPNRRRARRAQVCRPALRRHHETSGLLRCAADPHRHRLGALAQPLAAASAASPWPLALSLHPRDLEVEVGDGNFAQTLERLRISPTLMVYVANPERAVAIAEPLLGHYPGLSFSVALSLEKSIGPQESLWSYPLPERRRRIEQVETGLASANYTGLTLELEDAWGEASGLARLAAGE